MLQTSACVWSAGCGLPLACRSRHLAVRAVTLHACSPRSQLRSEWGACPAGGLVPGGAARTGWQLYLLLAPEAPPWFLGDGPWAHGAHAAMWFPGAACVLPHCRHPHLCDPRSARSWVPSAAMCRLCQRGPWLDRSSQQHQACRARCWCGRATKVTFFVLSLKLLDSVQGSGPATWATCFVGLSCQRLPGAQARRPPRPSSQHHAGRRSSPVCSFPEVEART